MKRISNRISNCAFLTHEARKYIQEKEYEMAIESYMNMKLNSKVCFNIGILFFRLGNYEMAHHYFQSCLKMDPYLTIGYYFYALMYQKLKDYKNSLSYYGKCLRSFRHCKSINYNPLGLPVIININHVYENLVYCYFKAGFQDFQIQQLLPNFKHDLEEVVLRLPYLSNELVLFKHTQAYKLNKD
eukprot:NODE_224_length_12322_cov_0.795549.p8 type:complete len:185 gc:universal NODE_224_length_12322_cov_0.795549:8196-7642(-)